jgi:hypothetical protein
VAPQTSHDVIDFVDGVLPDVRSRVPRLVKYGEYPSDRCWPSAGTDPPDGAY